MIAPRRLSNLSGFLLLLGIVVATVTTPTAQISGPTGLVATRSVNMVSGTSWPTGDPFLQRQNEPSVGVSTRNPQHLVAGANDYRTVDLPGLSTGPETGDAWLGLYKSFDGGERWQSTLLPGYPQDTTPEGIASPLHAYQAGADAVVRPGTNGLMYFSGLVFNRGANAPSAVFVSRLIDNNNKENGDPIAYLGTTLVDKSTGADFIDKPWMAVDVPRQGAKSCKITQTDLPPAVKPLSHPEKFHKPKKPAKTPPKLKNPKPYTQEIPAGVIYLAYSRITTVGTDVTARIMFTSSDDCGQTWAKPIQISDPLDKVNQGATIAIDPTTGAVTVAWRQFGLTTTSTDSIVVARSLMKGKFNSPEKVHKFLAHRPNDKLKKMIVEHQMGEADDVAEIAPFDQGTAEDRFRTNAYPSIAIDDESRAYLAWTERGFGAARSSATEGDARVVIATSKFGGAWTAPRAVDVGTNATDMPGHQLMPSVAFAAGKLVVVYYDLREDVSEVFGPFVAEKGLAVTVHKRHTIDIRSAYALKGDVPVFGPSTQVSQYLWGSRPGSNAQEQLQYNAPNLPLFKLGTVPFMGDYIDLAPSPAFVQENGAWKFNTKAQAAPVFHVVWTDNRDVRPPRDGDWTHYTPVKAAGVPGTFDPNQPAPSCVPGQTGMRNQNIYSARLTFGLVTGSPGNAKPIDATVPRGFVVFAQNTTTGVKSYRMTIVSQPAGGKASFTQTALAGHPDPLTSLDVTIPAKSMISRTVFITSTDPHAQVAVDVVEISAPAQSIVAGGLSSRVLLNPDISNPDISNPDISNPDISNPDISNAEVYNPDISNPDISNPDISNPDISNPDISNPDISNVVVANPDISNPDISNPDISNPDISNPDISNPDISNPDISNGALTDVTWTIVNTGNTTTSFNVNLFLANAAAKLAGVKTQLIVHKTYTTPIADECTLKSQTQTVLVANVPNPTFQAPGTTAPFDPSNPSVQNTTVWLEPGGTSKITLRIVDPNPQDGIKIDPVRDVTPVVTADPPVNTADIGVPNPPPPPAAVPPTAPDVHLNFAIAGEPTNTILTRAISPVQAHADVNGGPAAGVQVTIAIANNPAGGHLSGTTTLLTDAGGNATFTDLSIEKVGAGYQLSASASASGALPDISTPFNITFAPATASATGGTFVYDGQPHAGACNVTGFDNVALTGAISYSSVTAPVNAGNYTVTCTYSGNGYYGPASSSAPIVITPASSSTAVACSDATYTGAPQETCTAAATGAGGLSTNVPVTYSNNVNAGTATGSAAYPGDANHTGSSDSKNFTISKAASSTAVACSDTTYTGSAQEPCTSTVTSADGLNTTAPVTYTNNTNAGTASATSTYPGDANHAGSTDSKNFTISKAGSSTAVACSDTTYTGAAQEPCTSTVTGVGGLNTTAPVTYANNTNAGTASASSTYAGDANHAGSTDSKNFTISKAGSSTAVACSDTTYTGAAQEPCTSTVTGAGGLNTTAPVTYANNTNAGTASASSTYAGDSNHAGSTDSKSFTISKATSSTAVTCSDTTYTGAAQEPCTSTVTGAGGLSTTAPVTYTNNTNAGTATGSSTYVGDANHNGSNGSANFTIAPAGSTTTVTCSDTTYTGAPQERCTATVTRVGQANAATQVTYTNNVDVGQATGTATFNGDGNHTGSTDSKHFTIAPASSTTTVTCSDTTYTGAPRETCTSSVTGAGGLNTTAPVTYSNNTNAGTATGTSSYAGDANHSGSDGSANFTIARADSTTTVACADTTYNGTAQEPCTSTVTRVGDSNTTAPVTYTNNGVAGTATATAAYDGDANHTASIGHGTFTIAKASSTTTVACANTTYTGAARETCTATVTRPGDPTTTAPVTYANNVNAGTATGTAEYVGDANHSGSDASTNFTIAPAAPTATATGGTYTYDGQPHPGTCSISSGLTGSLTYVPGGNSAPVNVGDYAANCDYAGDANHTSAHASAAIKINPASTPTFVGPVGGGGGSPFGPIMCPAGTVATAFRGRAGDDIDRTELWCSPVLGGGSFGAASQAGAVGGFGGNDYGTSLTCPAGYAMTGIHGRAGNVGFGTIVDTIGVTCTSVTTGAVFTSGTVGLSAGTSPFALNCAAGKEVVGIAGGQGSLLDRIGIYCNDAVEPQPAADIETVELFSAETGFGLLNERADLIEDVIGRAIVKENRRRFTAPR